MTIAPDGPAREPVAASQAEAESDPEVLVPESHRHLLELPVVATLATVRPDGSPQCNPVWFRWDAARGRIELSQVTTTRKLRNLRLEPRLSLVIVDPANPFRYLEVRGVVEVIVDDDDLQFLRALTDHYLGPDSGRFLPDAARVVVRVRPTAYAKELGHGARRA